MALVRGRLGDGRTGSLRRPGQVCRSGNSSKGEKGGTTSARGGLVQRGDPTLALWCPGCAQDDLRGIAPPTQRAQGGSYSCGAGTTAGEIVVGFYERDLSFHFGGAKVIG
jgi:hypothetical protein